MPSILKLTKQLYPKALAFEMPSLGISERVHKVLAVHEAAAYDAGMKTLDVVLPDNDNFAADDASRWEKTMGIYSSSSVLLADRKKAILRKMTHPGTALYRQSDLYQTAQLQKAGFNVTVYENRFPDGMGGFISKPPGAVLTGSNTAAMHGFSQHGNVQHGQGFNTGISICVNDLDEVQDRNFIVNPDLRCTYYIAGATVSTFASVPAARKTEFRQLILQLKPAQTVAILFINYV